jgi:hypothetical protein
MGFSWTRLLDILGRKPDRQTGAPSDAKGQPQRYTGPNRRSGVDRREGENGQPSTGLRRSLTKRGRRKSDR